MPEKIEFGKKFLGAIPKGLGIGAIFFLIASGFNAVLGLWPFAAEIVFAMIGFAIPIADALTE